MSKEQTPNVEALIDQAVRATAAQVTQSMTQQIEALKSEYARQVAEMKEDHRVRLEQITKHSRDMATGAVQHITESSRVALDKHADAAEVDRQKLAKAAAHIVEQTGKLMDVADRAATLTARAEKAKAEADSAKEAADKAAKEAETKEAEAARAVAIMTLAGEAEVNRMQAEIAFNAEEKATMVALQRKRDEMEDEHDRIKDELTRGLQRYYPEVRKRLDELAAQKAETEGKKPGRGQK